MNAVPQATLAGGFVRDAIVGDPYNDIDIFRLSREAAQYIGRLMSARHGVEVRETEHKVEFDIEVLAPNTDGTMIMFEPRTVQLIHSSLIHDFDLCCCLNTYNLTDGLETWHGTLDRAIGMRRATPGTLARMYRLLRRGWTCSIRELIAAAKVAIPETKGS